MPSITTRRSWRRILTTGTCASLLVSPPLSLARALTVKDVVAPIAIVDAPFAVELAVEYDAANDLTAIDASSQVLYTVVTPFQQLNGSFPLIDPVTGVLATNFAIQGVTMTQLHYQPLNVTMKTTSLTAVAGTRTIAIWTLNGMISLVPLVFTIFLAVLTGSVLPSLYFGICTAALFIYGGDLGSAFTRSLDTIIMHALLDRGHQFIILFAYVMGGFVELLRNSGGANGLALALAKYAKTPRSAQFLTLFCGLLIFFDDYASALIIGATMLPITDALKVSRQKLAFLVDSGAAPVAALIPITSWTAFESGLLQEEIDKVVARGDSFPPGYETNGFLALLRVLRYAFYSINLIIFQFILISSGREFGPMLKAEREARNSRQTAALREGGAVDSSSSSSSSSAMKNVKATPRWINAAIPITFFVVTVLISLVAVGSASLPPGVEPTIAHIFSHVESIEVMYLVAFFSSIAAAILYRLQRVVVLARDEDDDRNNKHADAIPPAHNKRRVYLEREESRNVSSSHRSVPLMTFGESVEYWVEGVAHMTPTLIILVLAWSLGAAVSDLGAGRYIATVFSGSVDPRALPSLVFLTCCFIALATGTSYGTMGIMFPIVSPVAHLLAGDNSELYYCSMAAILEGAVFGDHCSMISDTTIMSSSSCKVDLKAHVVSQIPYAFYVAFFCLMCGFVPGGTQTIPLPACYLLSAGCMTLGLFLFAVRVDDPAEREDAFSTLISCVRARLFCCCRRTVVGAMTGTDPADVEMGASAFSSGGALSTASNRNAVAGHSTSPPPRTKMVEEDENDPSFSDYDDRDEDDDDDEVNDEADGILVRSSSSSKARERKRRASPAPPLTIFLPPSMVPEALSLGNARRDEDSAGVGVANVPQVKQGDVGEKIGELDSVEEEEDAVQVSPPPQQTSAASSEDTVVVVERGDERDAM